MGIRVKLIRKDNSTSPYPTLHPINLDVTDLSVVTERNISIFSLPVSDAKKVGLDFNIPNTVINIRGVLVDEAEGANQVDGADACKIFTYPFYPKSVNDRVSGIVSLVSQMSEQFYAVVARNASFGASEISADTYGLSLQGMFKLWTSMSTYSTTRLPISVFASHNNKLSGDSVYNSYLELVSSGFIREGRVVNNIPGSGTLKLSAPVTKSLVIGDRISRFGAEEFLDGMGFALVPFHWATGKRPSAIRRGTPIVFKFDGTANSAYSTLGSAVAASLVSGTKITQQSQGCIPTIKIPIKGIFSNPLTSSPVNSAPCAGLAKAIEAAINSSITVSDFDVISTGGKTVAHAFTASVTGTGSDLTEVKVLRDENGSLSDEPHYKDWYDEPYGINITPMAHYGLAGVGGVTSQTSDYGIDNKNGPATIPISNFKGGGKTHVQGQKLSAGDKVQNLLALFSNSPINSPTEIVGIQIPYDSLITSSSVNSEVRNFFLTYGSIPETQKTSVGNTRPASEIMDILKLETIIVEDEEEDSDNPIEQFVEWVGAVGASALDKLGVYGDVVGNLIGDVKLAINEGSMGNTGGMRIIASKLDINYQAGDTEYTFNILLSVVHHTISP